MNKRDRLVFAKTYLEGLEPKEGLASWNYGRGRDGRATRNRLRLFRTLKQELKKVSDEEFRRAMMDPGLAAELRQMPCTYCGGPGGTVDHVVPIARGGTSDPENLVPACQPCNSRKGTKNWVPDEGTPPVMSAPSSVSG